MIAPAGRGYRIARMTDNDDAAGEAVRAPDRRARRWSAFLLSLLAPGLGHLEIGYPRRMVA